MGEEKQFERIPPIRPGEEVLRLKRRPRRKLRRRLRPVPNVPGFFRFLGDVITETPLLPLVFTWVVLWLLFSMGIYFAEVGHASEIQTYGRALFCGVAAYSTAGISQVPQTGVGQLICGIWQTVGAALFIGIIVCTVTAYFQLPKTRPTKQITATVQYNLERLDDLSLEELETLKSASIALIEARIEQIRRRSTEAS
jgi:voltage-gated potassium channel